MFSISGRDSVALEATTKPGRRRMSMTEKTYDVAVVGASIAGCTAATLLAREGRAWP